MQAIETPIDTKSFEIPDLMAHFPPVLQHPNKKLVLEIALPAGEPIPVGVIHYSRWRAMPLPSAIEAGNRCTVEVRPDVYDYQRTDSGKAIDWHVNFADPHLFVAYGSRLLAQDELQVAEHPVLASLREALVASRIPPVTVEGNTATPVLVRGAHRLVAIDTAPNAAQGRPGGLYGNHFAVASEETIRRATRRLSPPTVGNLIAMAAPSGGQGPYKRSTIESILTTAYTAFHAAALEVHALGGTDAKTVVHTGYWGCGAFGGNRVLMPLLQIIAAQLVGIDRLVFHAVDRAGLGPVAEAQAVYAKRLGLGRHRGDLAWNVDLILGMGFKWGVSNGT